MSEEDTAGTFIRVTNREIWDKINSLEDVVLRMDQRMNNILEENVSLARRVRSLELKVYTVMSGMVAALLTGAGIILKGF